MLSVPCLVHPQEATEMLQRSSIFNTTFAMHTGPIASFIDIVRRELCRQYINTVDCVLHVSQMWAFTLQRVSLLRLSFPNVTLPTPASTYNA